MNEQMQDDPSSEEGQPQDAGQPATRDQPGEKAQPARQFKLTRQFAAGFLGWFLLNGLLWLLIFYRANFPSEMGVWATNGFFVFPLNMVIMLLLHSREKVRPIAQGILAAYGVNFIISLILGLSFNAICLVPFFTK